MADKYGIPPGGDPYPGKVKYWKGRDDWKLEDVGIAVAVAEAGWPEKLIPEAVSVAIAESGGKPYVYNTYKQGHFGLFQISRSAHADFFAGDSENWTIPTRNAQEAYKIYQSQGWKAWEASRLANMSRGRAAAAALKKLSPEKRKEYADVVGHPVADGPKIETPSLGDALTPDWMGVLSDAWEAITNPSTWMRVGYGTLGVVLVAGGLFLIVRSSPVVQKTSSAVAGAVPALKAVKGAA